MPIYEYRCEACGHELEQMQKISDPPLTDCPACGQSALRKRISAAAFRLKGGGWYETDFKKSNQKNLHDSGEKGEKKDAKPTEGGGASATSRETTATKSDAAAKTPSAPAARKPAA